ncbi:hypothetical protein [Nostoc sp.]|uniref:hypothetical protein n=1 Tax=Nostoc sp. TaxID=1180 RepID=UPI002FFA4177
MDFNYDLAMTTASDRVKGLRDDAANGTTVNPLFKNIRSVVEPFGNPGFHPQTDALPFFQIATTKEGITTISDDEFTTLDNPPTRLSRYDGNIECKYTISKVYFDYLTDDNLASYVENAYYENGYWIATKFKKRLCKPPTPPPPQPPKMECCPGQSDLLKLILKRIGTLPVIVPNSYLTKNGTQPIQNKNVESLTDFIAYFAERFDEVLGEFEINIQIQGDDNKSTTLKLPNLAEAIAEMFTMVIHSNMNNELILNIANRILAESGQIKQTSFKNHSALTALIDYAGFHTEMSVEQMPLTFTPGQKSFNTVLKESSQDVSVIKYTQKETLATAIHTLLQAAAIIRGVHYAKTPGGQAAVVKKLKEDLMGLVGDQNQGSLSDQIKTFVNNIDKVYDGINNKPSQP